MMHIQSLYIPNVDKHCNSQYIAEAFSKNRIAQVSRVFIEPHKYIKTDYNKAYVLIDSWCETESAYNFLKRLRNHITEARLVHGDDNWWTVHINKNHNKLFNKNVLTVFKLKKYEVEYGEDEDNISCAAIAEDEAEYDEESDDDADESYVDDVVKIDAEKTTILRKIVCEFKQNYEDEIQAREKLEFNSWFNEYLSAMNLICPEYDDEGNMYHPELIC
jgi:hypothetical protein